MQTKSIPYTFIRGGYFYFSRRVPNDLRKYYSYPRVVQGLRTSSPQKAKVQANVAAAKLEAYWSQMRLAESEVLGMALVREIPASNTLVRPSLSESMSSSQADCLSLLDALKVYLDLKGKGVQRHSVQPLNDLVIIWSVFVAISLYLNILEMMRFSLGIGLLLVD